jgi:hypothetical protein
VIVPAPVATPAPPEERKPRAPVRAAFPTETYVLGGVAAAGALSFTAFALAGKSRESCAPRCSDSQVATLRRDYVAADLSLVVALAAAGGAIYFALSKPPSDSGATNGAASARVWLGVQPSPHGASLSAGARF